MGEVYRARDAKLDRFVAIKILPRLFADDPERRTRFEREARALAALNHPNIAQIYGAEETDGGVAIVMELVDGEDLAGRIASGPIPLDEALPIARQMAEGLEAAHHQGIIHRDLKPANIKLRPNGMVKLLDFGLAKVVDAAVAKDPSHAPTITSAELTDVGVILGTAAYMSPEQARGRAIDKRADIWAFGCIFFEMLTARRAFAGDNQSDVLAAILKEEPPLAMLPAPTPSAVRRLISRCLQKDPADRLRDIGDARLEIRDAESGADGREAARLTGRPARWRETLAWAVASLMALTTAWVVTRPAPRPSEIRVEVATAPPTASPLSTAISPDGQSLAFVGLSGSESRLWVRTMRSDSPRALDGTEGAESPFWSPDSKSIGFFAEGALKRIDVDGGSVRTLANAAGGTDGSWGTQNVILFAGRGHPISRVPAEGGETTVVSGLKRGSNFSPQFLPDGRRFLYYLRASAEQRGVYVGDLEATPPDRRLVDSDAGAVYASSGHLLFVRKGTLFAQRFDSDRLTVAGDPFPVAEGVTTSTGQFVHTVSVSTTGSIAYRRNAALGQRQFVWFDRSGKELQRLGGPSSILNQPSLSRDGERVVYYRGQNSNVDVWAMDTRRGAVSRLTSDPADDVMAVISPDGARIVFSSNRSGTLELYSMAVSSTAAEELLFSDGTFKTPTDWSWDGRFLLFTTEGAKRSLDIWALPMTGERKPFPVVRSADFAEQGAQFSPDGNWVAYQSNESGRSEIYVQPFPGPGEKVPVSTTGGSQARWRKDGSELFYVARNGDLVAVPIRLSSRNQPPVIGAPTKLFTPEIAAMDFGDGRHQYMVSADGQRVLVATLSTPPSAPISLILNWKARPD